MNDIARDPWNASTGPAAEPGQHVLYRHWGKNGVLLYAGRTNNPPARLRQHRSESDWWALVSWTTYETFPSLEALKAGEAWAIAHEHPEHNIQGREYPATPRESPEPGEDRYPPVTYDLRLTVRLVHPLSRAFRVYGGSTAVRRAREWALFRRYYLLDCGPPCAHALYLMRCPGIGGRCFPGADHTQVWVPAPDFSGFGSFSGAPSPFILTQPYCDSDIIPEETAAYAAAHGLAAETLSSDAWYNPGRCTPIRLAPADRGYVLYPLEVEALSLMCAWRDEWPETIPEWLK